jgi:hypothetical protein
MIGIGSKSDRDHIFQLVIIVTLQVDNHHLNNESLSQILMD